MKNIRMIGYCAVVALFALAGPAYAQNWDEATDGRGDAGDLLSTAQVTSGIGPLTTITGILPGPGDVDIYRILITNPVTFSASSTADLPYGPPRLFLFDAAGFGVTGYFDSTNLGASLSDVNVSTASVYYLVMSGFSHPQGDDKGDKAIWFPGGRADLERVPDGIGAGLPLNSWSPSIQPYDPTNYTITLQGAAYTPEPATISLMTIGGLALLRRRRKQ
jgi:hypothetical protein